MQGYEKTIMRTTDGIAIDLEYADYEKLNPEEKRVTSEIDAYATFMFFLHEHRGNEIDLISKEGYVNINFINPLKHVTKIKPLSYSIDLVGSLFQKEREGDSKKFGRIFVGKEGKRINDINIEKHIESFSNDCINGFGKTLVSPSLVKRCSKAISTEQFTIYFKNNRKGKKYNYFGIKDDGSANKSTIIVQSPTGVNFAGLVGEYPTFLIGEDGGDVIVAFGDPITTLDKSGPIYGYSFIMHVSNKKLLRTIEDVSKYVPR